MRIRISRSIVPNLFTVLNIFFGFLCMVHAAQGKFVLAGWYVFLSAACDTLDGMMARLTRSASDFGVELDSLADVVSFGAAPSFLAYSLVLYAYPPLGPLVAASQLVFGALRLARFNVQLTGYTKDHFVGVPIPLSALTIVSFMLYFGPDAIRADVMLQYWFIGVILACGLLMVSTIRYPVLPTPSVRAFRERPVQMTLYLIAAVCILGSAGRLLFPVLAIVVLSGVVGALWRQIRKPHVNRRAAQPSSGPPAAQTPTPDSIPPPLHGGIAPDTDPDPDPRTS